MTTGRVFYQKISPIKGQIVIYRAGLGRTPAGTPFVLPSLATRASHLGNPRLVRLFLALSEFEKRVGKRNNGMDGLIFLLLFTLFLGFVSGWRYATHKSPKSLMAKKRFGFAQESDIPRWVPPENDLDCVCSEVIRTASAKSSVYDGWVYYFCSRECRERFETAPWTYLARIGLQPR
jgi:YHS domain-containing protein